MPPLIRDLFKRGSEKETYELKKLVLLSTCYFLSIFAFSIIKPFKQSIFLDIIGSDYQPRTKFLTLLSLPFAMAIYSKLVDKLRRHSLVIFTMLLYAGLSVVFAYFVWHPAYGLSNTVRSPYRILGWAFYVFGDFYQIFIVSSFWSFVNSITATKYAKINYGTLVGVSKIAGICSPQIAKSILLIPGYSDSLLTALSILLTAVTLVGSAFTIFYIKKSIPGYYLHGDEAVYKLEKKKAKRGVKETGILEGIKLLITQPYVFGIFGLAYSYEIISSIMDFQMLKMLDTSYAGNHLAKKMFLLNYTTGFQFVGLFLAFFGVRKLVGKLGVRTCLFIVPCITLALLLVTHFSPSLYAITIFMIFLRALNYGFNLPIKEMLYIPTVKDIKFKSRAWIDSFGKTISKTSGSGYNMITVGLGETARLAFSSGLSIGVTFIWAALAIFVGKKYKHAIDHNQVIGNGHNIPKTPQS